jgi:TonB family protein
VAGDRELEAAARGRATGPGLGPGDSPAQFQNLDPNFSTEGPLILSDTRGVDFGPYLARVVFNVRRNWYSMIPVAARLGQKGRVAIVFEILKDGSVPELRLVASSGSDSLDRAAVGAIRGSNPFPPLPEEFTGNHLVLQFIFLYNMGYWP